MSQNKRKNEEEIMLEKQRMENRRLSRDFWEKTVNSIDSNSDTYDRSILTLSTAGFGFLGWAVAFLKSTHHYWFMTSCIFFVATILCVLISFPISTAGLKKSLEYSEEYYNKGNHSYWNKRSSCSKLNDILNISSGVFFFLAVLSTLIFFGVSI